MFHGVSNDLLDLLVSEMKVEYVPPAEDVILQNEAPTDFFILLTGSVDFLFLMEGVEQLLRKESNDTTGSSRGKNW